MDHDVEINIDEVLEKPPELLLTVRTGRKGPIFGFALVMLHFQDWMR